jgi:hypothetical protein
VAEVKKRIAAAGFNPECKVTFAWWMKLADEDRQHFLKSERKLKREQKKVPAFTDVGIAEI